MVEMTIKITPKTKMKLIKMKLYPRETYDDTINRILTYFDSIKEKEVIKK